MKLVELQKISSQSSFDETFSAEIIQRKSFQKHFFLDFKFFLFFCVFLLIFSSSVWFWLSYKVHVGMLFDRTPIHRTLEIFFNFRNDEDRRRQHEQEKYVGAGEGFGLKDHLQRWKVNHQQLADKWKPDSGKKHFIGE